MVEELESGNPLCSALAVAKSAAIHNPELLTVRGGWNFEVFVMRTVMRTVAVCWGYIGIMENNMETTI